MSRCFPPLVEQDEDWAEEDFEDEDWGEEEE